MTNNICVINNQKICDQCQECLKCDLDTNKICDNCCKCLDEKNKNDYETIFIDDILF